MERAPKTTQDQSTTRFNTPAAIVEAGERIYAEQHRTCLEKEHTGEFVAIDVLTGSAYLAQYPEEALEKARAKAPGSVFHLMRVGFSSAFRG